MTKNEENIKDLRSTGRRRARKTLFNSRRAFKCETCGKTTASKPADAPDFFDEIWPVDLRVLTQLQAQHTTKDLLDNDEANLKWLCPSCHKLEDQQTGLGETTVKKEYF